MLPPQFTVNSLGPVHSITAFLPLLRASETKKIIVIESAAGDPKAILSLRLGNLCAYGMSKAAAVVAAIKFAIQLKNEGFVVVTLYPGLVGTSGTSSPSECASWTEAGCSADWHGDSCRVQHNVYNVQEGDCDPGRGAAAESGRCGCGAAEGNRWA